MNKIEISKEYSYTALRKGNNYVDWASKRKSIDIGYDFISTEGEKKEYICVKVSEDKKFSLSNIEFLAMEKFGRRKDSEYIIHNYTYNEDKIIDFNILRYDSENCTLVNIFDKNNIYTISREAEYKGIGYECVSKYLCTPKKTYALDKKEM